MARRRSQDWPSLGLADPLKSELDVLVRFLSQVAEAFEALALKLIETLPLRGLQA